MSAAWHAGAVSLGALAALALATAAAPPAASSGPPTGDPAGAGAAPRGSGGDEAAGAPRAPAAPSAEAPYDLLERVRGDELDGFHAALARTAAGEDGAITRVTHLGDSSIGLDQLTDALRRRFQDRFGDAGPGFALLQPHSASYRHARLPPVVRGEWSLCFLIFRCRADGRYGLGGVTVWSPGGAETVFRLPPAAGAPRRAELWYAAQPGGGTLLVATDGLRRLVATGSDRMEDARLSLRLPDEARLLRVAAMGGGVARAYGVVVEHERPGVVWDGLSMIGAFTNRLLAQDAEHLAGQVSWRDPDLVVLSYGGNDLRRVAAGRVTGEELRRETQEAILHVRRGKPRVPCVVVGINDHRKSGRFSVGADEVEAVNAAQRRASRAAGCAFFDTYRAMGGAGAFERWAAHRPPLVAADKKHLTRAGRLRLARLLHDALLRDHERWRARGAPSPR